MPFNQFVININFKWETFKALKIYLLKFWLSILTFMYALNSSGMSNSGMAICFNSLCFDSIWNWNMWDNWCENVHLNLLCSWRPTWIWRWGARWSWTPSSSGSWCWSFSWSSSWNRSFWSAVWFCISNSFWSLFILYFLWILYIILS